MVYFEKNYQTRPMLLDNILKTKDVSQNNFIYIIVNETTDVWGRYRANLLIGIINENAASVRVGQTK